MNQRTPAQLAEAPPTSGTHPAVTERLIAQLQDLTLWLETVDDATFAGDEPWDALAALRVAAESKAAGAQPLRPVIHGPTS